MSNKRAGYASYIRSTAWKKKRKERLELDGHRCCFCNHDGSVHRLEVHHKTYDNLRHEPTTDLATFCVRCHDIITNEIRKQRFAAQEARQPQVITASDKGRKDVSNGMENSNLRIERLGPNRNEERAECESYEQIRKSIKSH